MSSEKKYEHPGEWLPGDQVTDDEGRVWTHSDYGAHFEVPDATWMDHFVDQHIEAGRIAITHLVPRDEPTDQPPTLPNTEGWVRRAPGDVIEAGTPFIVRGVADEEVELQDAMEAEYWTPPPAPSEPWSSISTDRDKPTLARVTFDFGETGEAITDFWWRTGDKGLIAGHHGVYESTHTTDVELLHTHNPVTHVPVERALIEHVTNDPRSSTMANWAWEQLRAALASDESSASDGGPS